MLRAVVGYSARQRQTRRGLSGPGLAALVLSLAALPVRAGIFQWEWVDPQDPAKGKQQSSRLCPDGYGAAALANANLASRDLTQAYLYGADLTGANCSNTTFSGAFMSNRSTTLNPDAPRVYLRDANLTGAKFVGTDLNWADLTRANLANADFTDATIAGVSFTSTGLTVAQLCSTASYKAGNLRYVWFQDNDLTGVNLANQDLTITFFSRVNLTGANLSNANLAKVGLNANLTSANLTGANLTGASLKADLTNANLTRANLTEARLISANLAGANLDHADLTNASLVGASLKGASLQYGTLAGADFTGADLRSAKIYSTSLEQAKWDAADLRGCDMAYLAGRIGVNTIRPDGTIRGLQLSDGQVLTIRDRDTESGVPRIMALAAPTMPTHIEILESATMEQGGTLRLILQDMEWNSIISFEPSIPVALGGNLELALAPGVDPSAWVGRSIRLFNWWSDGQFQVTPTGQFNVISDDGLKWDTSALYTQGKVTLVAVPEPASVALLALGTLALLGRCRCQEVAS